jgi:hypothetical protein
VLDWTHQVSLECRVYGRQTSDMHTLLEEVRSELLDKFPTFICKEANVDYFPLLPEEVQEAERRGLMLTMSNERTAKMGMVMHAVVFKYVFSLTVGSSAEAEAICDDVEETMPGKFTSIRVTQDAWLDRSPH